MTETVIDMRTEIKRLQLLYLQTLDPVKKEQLKLQVLELQGQKLKAQISNTLFLAKLRKAGIIYDQTHKPRVDID